MEREALKHVDDALKLAKAIVKVLPNDPDAPRWKRRF